jgi:hypothetical protein
MTPVGLSRSNCVEELMDGRIMLKNVLISIGLLTTFFRLATAEDNSDYWDLKKLAAHASTAKDADRVIALAGKLVERSPGDVEAWYMLSVAYESSGNLTGAIAAGERVQILGYRARPVLSYRLARLHARVGDTEAALRWLERCLVERYENRQGIQSDDAFVALRDDSRFRKLAAMVPKEEWTRAAGWRFDLDYLIEEARRLHAAPSRPAFSRRFEVEAANLRDAIGNMTNDEIFAGMRRLVAILNDGHTSLYGPGPDAKLQFNRRTLPLKFYWFPDGLYIIDGVESAVEHTGSRVVRFGNLATDEVLRRLSEFSGVDNAMTWKWMGPQFYVRYLSLLREVGATTVDESIELTLLTPDGVEKRLTVEGGNFDIQRKLRPVPGSDRDVPRYLSRVDDHYWLEALPDHQALFFQFNQVRDAEQESIAKFAERLRKNLAQADVKNLIIDVRHNNGGNNSLVRPLIRAMVEFDVARPDHRIFVLMGRNTFSAAQNFINRIERWTDAVFVGEPSASSPNFVGEETSLLLPFSRIRGSISTRFWQDSDPGDHRVWIAPDIPVALEAADYFAGRDPVLEATLARIESAPDVHVGAVGR